MTEKQKLLSNINVSVFLLLRPRAVSAIHYDVKPASLPDLFIYFFITVLFEGPDRVNMCQ